ncbi:MAG: hypothetical protein AB8B57_17705 [Congregibacter sp.]
MNGLYRILGSALALASLLVGPTPAATASDPLFSQSTPLDITLTGPFQIINRKRDKEAEYPGSLSYTGADGEAVTLDAKFSVRGNFRLRKDVCSYAQLWVNLKKGQLKGTLFEKQDKLKLVVQCKSSSRYTDYLAREHQAYLMFQELSDISLDTRLLNVTYTDADTGRSRTHPGFFIEHQKRLAKAKDLTVLDADSAYKLRLDDRQSVLVSLFMYLIANTDYSMISALPGENCCHNIKVLEDANGVLYPVPYDFDSTGFVATSYAEPSGGIGQRNIKQRIYRGFCMSDSATEYALNRLRDKRGRIYAIMQEDPLSSEKGIRRAVEYTDKFYAVIDNPAKLEREIMDECR